MKWRIAVALGVVAALPACAGKQVAPRVGAATASVRDDTARAIAALDKGDWKTARKRLNAVLEKKPRDATATKLLRQIDIDPKLLLGARSFAYRSKKGDSFQLLAQRHLGDRLMFYALARYNGMMVPAQLPAGSTLRIPGIERFATPKPVTPKSSPPAATIVMPKAAGPKAAAPALAGALRRQGLAALTKGEPNRAVALLSRAAQAEPGNKLIAADLARARRVQAAVR